MKSPFPFHLVESKRTPLLSPRIHLTFFRPDCFNQNQPTPGLKAGSLSFLFSHPWTYWLALSVWCVAWGARVCIPLQHCFTIRTRRMRMKLTVLSMIAAMVSPSMKILRYYAMKSQTLKPSILHWWRSCCWMHGGWVLWERFHFKDTLTTGWLLKHMFENVWSEQKFLPTRSGSADARFAVLPGFWELLHPVKNLHYSWQWFLKHFNYYGLL